MYNNDSVKKWIVKNGPQGEQFNKEEFVEEVREAMLDSRAKLKIKFKGSYEEANKFVGEAVRKAFEIDDKSTSSDYDYLRYRYKGMRVVIKGMLNSYEVVYSFQYNETADQTRKVDEVIKEKLKHLEIDKKSDLEKIKAIHDFIVVNAKYDTGLKRNTAYDNLIHKKSVCQGYAALTYKMMVEAGIPCRIITGTAKDVNHAWNIVELDGSWYNIDCTWDDPVSSDGRSHLEYKYFLKNEEDFKDHVRDQEYMSDKFKNRYKMTNKSYTIE
ncbi:protease, putative [Lachnospiraceae bacterium KM106-2]|nr:protease, putative [Lachnospiraceae bacterium KM106-2]